MIAFIEGKIQESDPTHVVIAASGVGYHIHISLNTYTDIKDKESVRLHTHFHVKEDIQSLYGFSTARERETFRLLISINGVGPNTALMVLSTLNAAELQSAVLSNDVKAIQKVKGIGAKTAQRIILELKDKFSGQEIGSDTDTSSQPSYNMVKEEALTALVTLGIPKSTAQRSLELAIKTADNTITVEELIKRALKTA